MSGGGEACDEGAVSRVFSFSQHVEAQARANIQRKGSDDSVTTPQLAHGMHGTCMSKLR